MPVNKIHGVPQTAAMKKLSEQLTIRLPQDVATEIDLIAEKSGSNPTEILRQCVLAGLPKMRAGYDLIFTKPAASVKLPSKK